MGDISPKSKTEWVALLVAAGLIASVKVPTYPIRWFIWKMRGGLWEAEKPKVWRL